MKQDNSRYWVNVVSHEHVKTGIELGIVQSCHGKASPLKRMHPGDWLVHYSPKEAFMGTESCQMFTSIGQIPDEEIYQFDMGGGFVPWRRRVRYVDSVPLAIVNLLEDLSFTKGKGRYWGGSFRYGFFEMQEQDFKLIYSEMTGCPASEVK
jgi:hypothetical protein